MASPISLSDRSIESTGTDLMIEPLGDLVTNSYGDLETQSGEKSIVDSLLRRLNTPINGYSRWIHTVDGLKGINTGYGNRIYSYLSSPLTGPILEEIKLAVKECVKEEDRVSVNSVAVKKTSLNSVEVNLSYIIKGEAELKTLLTNLRLSNNV
jgi:phage baseplate assembly protein W